MPKYLGLVALPLLAVPLVAQSDAPKYAATASEIANAIRDGADLRAREDLPTLSEIEYSEIARLAGCEGTLLRGGRDQMVVINWTCGETSAQIGLTRSTAMLFDTDGVLYGFAINPVVAEFVPNDAAQMVDDLPSRYGLAKEFAEAVASGGDATLGGILDLGTYEAARLAELEGSDFRVSIRNVGDSKRIRFGKWIDDQRFSGSVHLFFDEADRPTGLIFAPTFDDDWASPDGSDRVDHGHRVNREPRGNRRPDACPIC